MLRFLTSPLRLTLLLPLAALAACSHKKELAKAPPPPPPPQDIIEVRIPELDGRGSYRFNMSEGDKKMSADEFDAWMKANGIRVAKGR